MGLRSLLTLRRIDPALDVDLFVYLTQGDVPYIANLVLFSQDEVRLDTGRGWYGVSAAAVCFKKPMIPANFRYIRKSNSDYWRKQLQLERSFLRVLDRFVPGHYLFPFLLTEQARGLFLVKIPPSYASLAPPQGFPFEMELLFFYKSSTFLADPTSRLRVATYTYRVLRVIAAMLFDVYDTLCLWCLPRFVAVFTETWRWHGDILGSYAQRARSS